MRYVAKLLVVTLVISCTTTSRERSFSFTDIKTIRPSTTTKKQIVKRFGQPDQRDLVKLNKETSKGALEYWAFKKNGHTRLHMTFFRDKIRSVSYDIFEADREFSLDYLLKELPGKYDIIAEPFKNPHAAPTKCYLVDKSRGISVLVNSYKKAPLIASIWHPKDGQKTKWFDSSKTEYCIGGSCAKVTKSSQWKSNHCKWLEAVLKKTYQSQSEDQ